ILVEKTQKTSIGNEKIMRIKLCRYVLAAGLLGSSSYAAVVNAPWAPNTGNTSEQNLYNLLGMPDNSYAQVGGANGKQIATDETWSTAIGSQFSSLLIEQAGNAGNNAFGVY